MSAGDGFLARWSRRKRAAAAGEMPSQPDRAAPPRPAAVPEGPGATKEGEPIQAAPLPPVESLSIDSDFSPFMASDVDPQLRQAALRKLFEDERFNVMDGLDVYIDDYSKPSPIPPAWYAKMAQMAYLGDYAATQEEAKAREAASAQPESPDTAAQPVPEIGEQGPATACADGGLDDISQYDVSGARPPPDDAPE